MIEMLALITDGLLADPGTYLAIAAISSVAAGGIAAFSMIQQGRAAESQA